MVRLEVEQFPDMGYMYAKFQFLYGTIGSHVHHKDHNKLNKFQFLYGTIGSRKNIQNGITPRQISIPVWYDWKV